MSRHTLYFFIGRGDIILTNCNRKNSKNLLFSDMCKRFHVEKKQQKKFREWLLYNTTIDPFLLFLKKEDIQKIEDWLKEKQKELLRQEKKSGSNL